MSTPPSESTESQEAAFGPTAGVAFAVGWQVGSLATHLAPADAGSGENGLPEATALPPIDPYQRVRAQIMSGLHRLNPNLESAGLQAIETQGLDDAINAAGGDPTVLCKQIEGFDGGCSSSLTAADGRLGKAYNLGRALARTCLVPEDRESFDDAFGPRVVDIKNWLADLASSFPPHAGRAVIISLRTWERWAAEPKLNGEDLDWATQGPIVRTALRRQGDIWRALLSGEKDGPDMLDTSHYLGAANSLVVEMAKTVRGFVRPFWLPLLGLTALLAGGIALIVLAGDPGKVVGAVAAAAGAVGLTGAGLRARLGQVAGQLETQLWGAELDYAIAQAVLVGPKGWNASIVDVRASGPESRVGSSLEAMAEFRALLDPQKPVEKGWRRKDRDDELRSLLALDAVFVTDGQERRGQASIVKWLRGDAAMARRIATEPSEVVAARTGILITYVPEGADVWWVREGKIRHWQAFDSVEAAREHAGLPPTEAAPETGEARQGRFSREPEGVTPAGGGAA